MKFKTSLLVLGLGLNFGCLHIPKLIPVSQISPEIPYVSETAASGVKLLAETNAWKSFPYNLDEEILTVKVTIENQGTRVLKIQNNLFSLEYQEDKFSALPLFAIDQTVTVAGPPSTPHFAGGAAFGQGMGSRFYDGRYYLDEPYFLSNYPYWQVPLPTKDMVEKALPEGMLSPKGKIGGFIFFAKPPKEVSKLELRMKLVDRDSGEDFGSLSVPYTYR